jgi:hypothetical protein
MKRRTGVFWLIWGIALLPLAGAVLAYSLRLPVAEGRTNHGELLQPVPTLAQWGGEPSVHTGHWTLILKPVGSCEARCQQQLARLRSVHDALGRDATRVQVLLAETEPAQLGTGVWIVDPIGNLVLRYRPAQIGPELLEDLERLLKVSNLG